MDRHWPFSNIFSLTLWLRLKAESNWRDFVRGHLVGHNRRLGFIGPFPFLVLFRCFVLIAIAVRFSLNANLPKGHSLSSPSVYIPFAVMVLLAALNVHVTYRFQNPGNRYDTFQSGRFIYLFVVCDILFVSYVYSIIHIPQSDLFLLYFLPILTATEYLGGWPTAAVFFAITIMFGVILFAPNPGQNLLWLVFAVREAFLLFVTILSLFLFQVSCETTGSPLTALRELSQEAKLNIDRERQIDKLFQRCLELKFEFAGLSTVDPYKHIVEMTRARNIPSGWMRRSRRDLGGKDIIADVLRNGRYETPTSDDPRFDAVTYRIFKHEQLARAYIPIYSLTHEPVGVLQVGWERKNHGDKIPDGLVADVVGAVANECQTVSDVRFHRFVERVCHLIVGSVLEAHAAAIYVYSGEELIVEGGYGLTPSFVHRVGADREGPAWKIANGPKRDCWDVENPLDFSFPILKQHGMEGLIGVPFAFGEGSCGVLLLFFKKPCIVGKWMLAQVDLLAAHTQSAIQNRLLLIRAAAVSSRAWMQSRLLTVEDALEGNTDLRDVLQRIADHFLYNLEADCVTLYEYFQGTRQFKAPPITSGEFLMPTLMRMEVRPGDLVWSLIEAKSFFETRTPDHTEFVNARTDGFSHERFVLREQVNSSAVLVLEVGDQSEKVGLIFVNYRRQVHFTPEDRAAMLSMAGSAAVAIRNARVVERLKKTLKAIGDIDHMIIGSARRAELDSVLNVILESAQALAGADAAWVLWLDPRRQELEWRVARNVPERPKPHLQPLNYGLVGRAARTRASILCADVAKDGDYKATMPQTRSELAVPLYDQDRLLGVLNLESERLSAFTEDDRFNVELLSLLAVIAARVIELYQFVDPLIALSAVAAKLQDDEYDLDTMLRLILTGVTAKQGLGFTRAMIFLKETESGLLRGRIAVGPASIIEARDIWEWLTNQEERVSQLGQDFLDWLLDESVRTSQRISSSGNDCKLSTLIESIEIPDSTLFRTDYELINGEQDSPLAPLLLQLGESTRMVCVPLRTRNSYRGILIADRSFQGSMDRRDDTKLLQHFANVAATAVESRVFRVGKTYAERVANWNHVVEYAFHAVGSRLTVTDGHLKKLERRAQTSAVPAAELRSFVIAMRKKIILISNILAKIRPSNKGFGELEERIEIVSFLSNVVAEVAPSIRTRLHSQFQEANGPLFVRAISWDLEDAFVELLQNADEAAFGLRGGDGELAIALIGQSGSTVLIEVNDNGPGIPEGRKERIFETGFTTKTAHTSGHGLGLAIVRFTLESFGGRISEIGIEGKGACFRIELPVDGYRPAAGLEELQ